ncbi:MAG: hypothetical protein A2Z17_05550 [Gammaproteobacteria bacterium RBG_16_66_13]|nr:MAG: hypothetical protein A2Z17_05550 [Gammaproteobacteria bacterium RBG_16_66_13]
MAILTPDRIEPLLQVAAGPCVSLFMPTHRHHPGTAQDPIRFKNALREAKRLLSDRYSGRDIRSLLDPVAALPDTEFWRYQADGLAIFRSPDRLEHYRVALAVPELVVVAESFHVRPLLRCLQSNLRYFVIALSQNSVAVYESTSSSFVAADIPDLPVEMSAFAAGAKGRGALTAHSTGAGRNARMVHAAGSSEALAKEELARYFRAIDRAIAGALGNVDAPLILAGVGYYFPIYREVSRLRNLAEDAIEGSPDAMTPEELHARAWSVAGAILRKNEDRALEGYGRAVEKDRALDDLEVIAREALGGRIRQLFLAQDAHAWGTLDRATGQLNRWNEQQGSHDDDLLDDVAEAVIARGGEVISLPRERMPGGKDVVALLRY